MCSWRSPAVWINVAILTSRAEIERQAQAITPQAVCTYLHTLRRVEGYLHHTVNTRLALDVLLLQLPRPGR